MLLGSGTHLSYCSNIHPGETWEEVAANLRRYVPRIKQQLCPDAPFGLGLRLSAMAARKLEEPQAFAELCELLAELDAYVFTINGFPHGQFHEGSIKQSVYQPDWRTEDRLAYTLSLARLMARLVQQGASRSESLSISTVPGCYRYVPDVGDAPRQIAHQLHRLGGALFQMEQETGAHVTVGLEPEPACLLETTSEAVQFFEDELLSRRALTESRIFAGVPWDEAEARLRRHLGLCLDTCHSAVQFEDPRASIQAILASGIAVTKMQVTAGLEVPRATPEALEQLQQFDDGRYLHQGTAQLPNGLKQFIDLPEAQRDPALVDAPWRVHFHVPVFLRDLGPFRSTQDDLLVFLEEQRRAPFTSHVEVETYTFSVLPTEYKPDDVCSAIVRELAWTRAQLCP